jgi:predicted GNAT family N-acyltransferase
VEATRLSGATCEERVKTFATLVSAFRADPVERWLYPDEKDYQQHFPKFLAAFGGEAFAHDAVWRLDDFAAVAMWLPPDAAPNGDEIVRVLMTTVDQSRHSDTMVAIEQMDAAHPRYPHWYLPWFGVDATMQGMGMGGTLMARCLTAVDDTDLPAYLETPNPRTVPFYVRHGFRVTGSTYTEDCPPITFMLRQPSTSSRTWALSGSRRCSPPFLSFAVDPSHRPHHRLSEVVLVTF